MTHTRPNSTSHVTTSYYNTSCFYGHPFPGRTPPGEGREGEFTYSLSRCTRVCAFFVARGRQPAVRGSGAVQHDPPAEGHPPRVGAHHVPHGQDALAAASRHRRQGEHPSDRPALLHRSSSLHADGSRSRADCGAGALCRSVHINTLPRSCQTHFHPTHSCNTFPPPK